MRTSPDVSVRDGAQTGAPVPLYGERRTIVVPPRVSQIAAALTILWRSAGPLSRTIAPHPPLDR
jgi:hypothetical protein